MEKDLAEHLIGDALENVVSAFDGFGREVCERKGAESPVSEPRRGTQARAGNVRIRLRRWSLQRRIGRRKCRVFQKRHLLAHKMSVIDEILHPKGE